jgi:hypothetical protein
MRHTNPPRDLQAVVEAVFDIAVFDTTAGRDAVLMLLRRELASSIARLPTTRMDTMSIVTACDRYPGGLAELVEAIRFYANGSIAMTRLDALIGELPPDPGPISGRS